MQAASDDRPVTTPDVIFSHSDGEVLTLDVYQPAQPTAAVGVESSVHLLPGTAHAKGYLEKAVGGSLDFVARTLGAS